MSKQSKRHMGQKVYSTEGVDSINVDSAGVVTVGPSGSSAINHKVNGASRLGEATVSCKKITLANGAEYTSPDFVFRGMLLISRTTTENQALLLLGNTSAALIADQDSIVAVADTAGKICVFFTAAPNTWKIKNNTGVTITLNVTYIANGGEYYLG